MASSEELVPLLPDTLPEDFGEWDNEAAPPASPANSAEREAWESGNSFGESANPVWKSADRDAFIDSLGGRPRAAGSTSSATVLDKPQNGSAGHNGHDHDGLDHNGHDHDSHDHDSESFAMPLPVTPLEWEAWEASRPFVKAPKQPGQSARRETVSSPAREAVSSPKVEKPRDSSSTASAPAVLKQQDATNELVLDPPRRAPQKPLTSRATNAAPVAPSRPSAAATQSMRKSPEAAAKLQRNADDAISELFSPRKTVALEEPTSGKKKRMIFAGVGLSSILLLLFFLLPLLHRGAKSAPQPSVQPAAEVPDTQPEISAPKPAAHKASTQETPAASANQPSSQDQEVNLAKTPTANQTKMMNDQLSAPTRIPKQVAEDTDPPAGFAAPSGGLGGNNPNIGAFNGHARPVVKAVPPKPIIISSGVATGMLIRKTEPVYPSIAKAARVDGTVVLHATIAKDGSIEDVRAVSGPKMLEGAAVDAVRTWRYKPYKLNNEPTELETTINIVFSLGQ